MAVTLGEARWGGDVLLQDERDQSTSSVLRVAKTARVKAAGEGCGIASFGLRPVCFGCVRFHGDDEKGVFGFRTSIENLITG
jgi:hypothetical protein